MFLIIFRYLGDAIFELGHQYSVEKSRHIIATSFPRHLSEWPTLEAQEWYFCNSKWQSGSFINMSGRGEVTTKLGLHVMHQPLLLLPHSLKPPFFVLQASMEVPPCGFSRFCLIFTVFMHIWQHPLRVLRFEFVFYIGQLILWFHWLGTIPIHGVFRFIYHSTIFYIPLKLEISLLLLICVFRIQKLGILLISMSS